MNSSRLKIAIIGHVMFPIVRPFHGGLEMFTHLLTRSLMERGHEVVLFALPGSDPSFDLRVPPLDVFAPEDSYALREDNPGFEPDFMNNFNAHLWIMRQIRDGGFDVVHNNSLHYLPIAMAEIAGCPIITTFHTPPFPALQSAAMIAGSSPANHFVAISEYMGSQWRAYVPGYSVIYNGLNPGSWAFNPNPVLKTAIWVGRICPEKGTHLAVQAARAAGYQLTLVGNVFDERYFSEEVAPLLGPDVKLAGHLDHHEVADAIGRAEVGLFTSTWEEPFGLVLIEMLACGTPVVAFGGGAVDEILTPACGVVVPNEDATALAHAIPVAARLKRTACRAHVSETFPISRMLEQYEDLYRSLQRRVVAIGH